MFRLLSFSIKFLLVVFILPALAHAAIWTLQDKPSSWRDANWSSAGILPSRPGTDKAQIMVLSARTGGLKGAFATHSWLVLKKPGEDRYTRYDVVGWGSPVRKNGYAADARWYSNEPVINHRIEGKEAAELIPRVEQAIENYPWRHRGDYRIWPGPNSNTFVASVLRAVPELKAQTVSTAVGRDFPENGRIFGLRSDGSYFISASGYLGASLGGTSGLELNFLGLVAGFNPGARAIKIPAFGTYRW